jgi:hypothetical protein
VAGKATYDFGTDEALLAILAEHRGEIAAASDRFGCGGSTLRAALKKRGLMDRVNEMRAVRQVAARAKPVTEEVSREEILEQEVRELRAASNRGRKAEVKEERLTRAVEEALRSVAPPTRQRPARVSTAAAGKAHHRQLVQWSDWHGGEVVDPDAVNGLNAYSWEIMEARVDEMIDAMLSHKRVSPELTGLDIIVGGDMNSGSNHRELAETNQYPLAEQGVRMGFLLGTAIEKLTDEYRSIRVLNIVGNHPRLALKPAAKNVHDNMDWVSGIIAREHLKAYKHVEVRCPTSAAAFWEIAGRTFYVWHGDGVRSSMPGVPWGGLMRRVNEIRRSHATRRIDGFFTHHFHQANAMFDLGIFMNGSLKGTDEWVLKSFGGGAPPTQVLYTFDERRSRLTKASLLTPTAGLP